MIDVARKIGRREGTEEKESESEREKYNKIERNRPNKRQLKRMKWHESKCESNNK